MRVGFSIVFNGIHHLTHDDYGWRLANMLDYWVVVDGLALPNGSTSWCKDVPVSLHRGGGSSDGTVEYLEALSADMGHEKLVVIPARGSPWHSKDVMVNTALTKLRELVGPSECFLWEFDVDEQWDSYQLATAEKELELRGGDTGMFLCDYFVGKKLLACGEWGEGVKLPYRRLWKWKGQAFQTHEPPELVGGNGKMELLSCRFKHYAYAFEKDVEFKEQYYGDAGLLERWRKLQLRNDFPAPVSDLITGPWSQTATHIVPV